MKSNWEKASTEKVKAAYTERKRKKAVCMALFGFAEDETDEYWAWLKGHGINKPGARADGAPRKRKTTTTPVVDAAVDCCVDVAVGSYCGECGTLKEAPPAVDAAVGCCVGVVVGAYCSACGTRKEAAAAESCHCPACGAIVAGNFCGACGEACGTRRHAARLFDGAELEGETDPHQENAKGNPSAFIAVKCNVKGEYFGTLYLNRETYGDVEESGIARVTIQV